MIDLLNQTPGMSVQAAVWNLMPVWYHLVFLGLLVPGCLLGARLKGIPTESRTVGP